MFGGKPAVPPTPTRGVPVVLGDGRERHLRYSLGAMQELQQEFGEQLEIGNFKGMEIAKLLWFGLRWEDPELTPEGVADLVDLENLEVVVTAMGRALGNKETKVKVEDPSAPPPAESASART